MNKSKVRMFGGWKSGFQKPTWKKVGWIMFGLWLFMMTWGWLWGLIVEAPIAMSSYHAKQKGLIKEESSASSRVTPQGKSVGGPLRCSNNAKAKLRERIRTESVDANGVAFVGCYPPGSWMDLRTFCGSAPGSWEAYLVEYGSASFSSLDVLRGNAVAGHHKRSAALRLQGLKPSSSGSLDERRLNNLTGTSEGDAGKLVEDYVRIAGSGVSALRMDRVEPVGTFQYELEVGSEAVQILELPRSFKWLWIAPVHHTCYQSRFLGRPLTSRGIRIQEAQQIAATESDVMVRNQITSIITTKTTEVAGYREDHEFQAVLIERNGEISTLSEAVLLQQGAVGNGPIRIWLNLPNDSNLTRYTKSAKLSVGIQP